ncbi:MAG: type II toxin-antitoxin system prevent-host-death family antitoxin [Acidimicrobiia bacterium]|nr:type II toxin-antitoxin system prevent-host-death family antitoxin [Acidimicrobiia bacterium]
MATRGRSGSPSVVGVHEAKTHLSRLLERVVIGEEIDISRRGEIVARLVPVREHGRRQLGAHRDLVVIHDDFDDPRPDDFRDAFGQ